jgi:exonuclease III/ribonuclease HI
MSDWSMLDSNLNGSYYESAPGPRTRQRREQQRNSPPREEQNSNVPPKDKEEMESEDADRNEPQDTIPMDADSPDLGMEEEDRESIPMDTDRPDVDMNEEDRESTTSLVSIRSTNNQRKAWTKQTTKEAVDRMIKKGIAIHGWQETGIFKEKEQFFTDQRCHCFFQSFSQIERKVQHKAKQVRKIDEQITNAKNDKPDGWEQLVSSLENTRVSVMKATTAGNLSKQGIALFVDKALFPTCKLLSNSQFHITVLATPVQKHKALMLTVVYGPPDSSSKNNQFWKETIIDSIELASSSQRAHAIFGDMNAVMKPHKDKSNKTAKYTKLAMAETIRGYGYNDVWRKQHKDETRYTWKRGDSEARLDYIFVNSKFEDDQMTAQSEARILPKTSDHNTVSLSFSLQHHPRKERAKRERYSRIIPEEQMKETATKLEAMCRDDSTSDLAKFTQFEDMMKTLNKEHLIIAPAANKETVPFSIKKIKKALANIGKLIGDLETLDPQDTEGTRYIRTVIEMPTNLDRCNHLDNAAKRILKMQHLHADLTDTTLPPCRKAKHWIKEYQKRAETLRRKLQQTRKKEEKSQIAKRIERLIEAHQSDPKTFWRKMKPFGSSKTLTAVEIEETTRCTETGRYSTTTHTFATDEEVIREVAKFQADVFASKGTIDYANFINKWRPNAPNLEDDECRQQAERDPERKELLEALRTAARGKSTGSDNTAVETIAQLAGNEPNSAIITILHRLILAIWKGDALPESWRTGQMILIYKDGSETSIGNYRPITLLQASYKLYSHILSERATAFVEKRNILSESQYGFRAGRSTAHALFATTEAIRTAANSNTPLHMVFVDFKKAFDSIEHDVLDAVLSEAFYGIPPKLGEALRQTYRNRSILMKMEQGDSLPFPIGRGVPQGDPLSSLLFILAINPLLQALELLPGATVHGVNYPAGAFCDDLTLNANSYEHICRLWNKLSEYSEDTRMYINQRKTDYATNKHVPGHETASLKFDDVEITHQDGNTPIRSLGLWVTLNGDTASHKSRSSGLLQADLVRLKSKAITDLQFLDVLKKMTLPKLCYSLGLLEYSADELSALQKRTEMSIIKRLRLPDRHYSDWIQMDVKLGGLGIPSVQTLYACQKSATLLQIARGPESTPKKILLAQLARENTSTKQIEIRDSKSLWSQTSSQLAKFGAKLQTAKVYTGWETLLGDIDSTQEGSDLLDEIGPLTSKQDKFDLLFQLEHDPAENTRIVQRPINHINEALTEHSRRTNPAAPPSLVTPTQLTILSEALDRHTATNQSLRTSPNAIHDTAPLHNKSLLEVTILDKEFKSDGSLKPLPGSHTYAKAIFTDGSQKDGKASYGISRTVKEHFPSELTSGRAEGKQTNHRGELTAILGVLSAIRGPLSKHAFHQANNIERPCDLIIATDSESGIKATLEFQNKTRTEQLRTPDRDLILDICAHKKRIETVYNTQTFFLHVPAHTADSALPNKKNQGRKAAFIAMIGNKTLAEKLLQGNKRADEAAEIGRVKGAQHKRDWHKNPTDFVDPVFVTQRSINTNPADNTFQNDIADLLGAEHIDDEDERPDDEDERPDAQQDSVLKNHIVDTSIHKFIKTQAQIKAVNSRTEKRNQKRNIYLRELKHCDKKLSFPTTASSSPALQKITIHLFKRRMYSLDTMKKMHRKGNPGRNDESLLHKYYQRMYPDTTCHACSLFLFLNPQPDETAPEEDTEHMIDCERVPGKVELFQDTWSMIRLRLNNYPKAKPERVAQLYPFTSSTEQMRRASPQVDQKTLPALWAVKAASAAMCRAVLTPAALRAALQECGLSKEQATDEAGRISLEVQAAAAASFRLRCNQIATDRNQRRVYREEVTDKLRPPTPPSPPAPTVLLFARPSGPPSKRFCPVRPAARLPPRLRPFDNG